MQKQILGHPGSPPTQFTHGPGCLTRSGRSLDGEESGRVHAHTHTHTHHTSPTTTHAQTHTCTHTTYTLPHHTGMHAHTHTYAQTTHTTYAHILINTHSHHNHINTCTRTNTHVHTHIPHIHRVVPGRFWKESLAQLLSKPPGSKGASRWSQPSRQASQCL